MPTAVVLRLPGVARLLAVSLVGRMPGAALGLVLVLRVRDLGGSYALGGLVSGAFALGLAAGAPLLGRAVDARGQTRVLTFAAALSGVALTALAAVPDGRRPPSSSPWPRSAGPLSRRWPPACAPCGAVRSRTRTRVTPCSRSRPPCRS